MRSRRGGAKGGAGLSLQDTLSQAQDASVEAPTTAEWLITHLSLEVKLDWLEGFSVSSLRHLIIHIPAAAFPNTHSVLAPAHWYPLCVSTIMLRHHSVPTPLPRTTTPSVPIMPHHAASTYFGKLGCCLASTQKLERRFPRLLEPWVQDGYTSLPGAPGTWLEPQGCSLSLHTQPNSRHAGYAHR